MKRSRSLSMIQKVLETKESDTSDEDACATGKTLSQRRDHQSIVANTPSRRYSIHEVPSPSAYETVLGTVCAKKRSRRAKSLFTEATEENRSIDSDASVESIVPSEANTITINAEVHKENLEMQEYESLDVSDQSPVLEKIRRCRARTRGGSVKKRSVRVLRPHMTESQIIAHDDNKEDNPVQSYVSCKARKYNERPREYSPGQALATIDTSIIENRTKTLDETTETLKCHGNMLSDVDPDIITDMSKTVDHGINIFDRTLSDIDSNIIKEMTDMFGKEAENDKSNKAASNVLSDAELMEALNSIHSDDEFLSDIDNENDRIYNEQSDEEFCEENVDSPLTNENSQLVNETEISNLTWVDETIQKVTIEFEKAKKQLKVLPPGNEPIDFFMHLANEELFNLLINKANKNAEKLISKIRVPHSRLNSWKDITIQEMKKFLGLLFHMGTIKLNRITDYWKKHPLLNIPCFAQQMSRNRFLLILRALNFEDESMVNNRLSKIDPLVRYFNERMDTVYAPTQNLSIDESIVLFRGRLIFRQYLKGKRHPYGIKLYILADEFGVVLKIIVYAGAGDPLIGGTGHADKVVMELLSKYLNAGYCIYMDNFYNSVSLCKKLLSLKTYCTGTLRANRKYTPKDVVQRKLKRGESVAKFTDGGICVMKWRDKRDVLLISSEFGSEMKETTTRRGDTVSKPEMVLKYNKYMGGIDHQDQMLSYYSCEHKTIKWYKKLGVHIFQQLLYNAYTLYNIFNANKKSFYDFRFEVIEKLLNIEVLEQEQNTENSENKKVHILQPCPRKKGINKHSLRRRCKQCWLEKKVRKDTPKYCPDCPDKPGLCEVGCFQKYHNY